MLVRVWSCRNSHFLLMGMQNGSATAQTSEDSLATLTKLNICCYSNTQSSPTLCNPVDCSMPGFSVPHCLLESAQTHVHWVSDAIQPTHPVKLNILWPHGPVVVLHAIHPKEIKIYVHTKICSWIFLAAFFTIAKTWKQTKCPSVGEWMVGKIWCMQTMEYFHQ